jgi:hypothetical protein
MRTFQQLALLTKTGGYMLVPAYNGSSSEPHASWQRTVVPYSPGRASHLNTHLTGRRRRRQ